MYAPAQAKSSNSPQSSLATPQSIQMAPPHTMAKPTTGCRKPSKAAEPSRNIFDPWNSASTGHQRAENRLSGSTSWHTSRSMKLGHQFKAGHSGGTRLCDTVGAGSKDWKKDGRKENGGWEKGAPGLREPGWQDVRGLLRGKEAEATIADSTPQQPEPLKSKSDPGNNSGGIRNQESEVGESGTKSIFRDLTIYINGSTAPLVSDHKLKRLLAENGARISIALGRRSVTHVILGTPNGATGGAGGGLAAGKIQKEIQRVGGCGVKYVSVDWVLDSIKAGRKIPEARYANLNIAHKNQRSVYGMFKREGSHSSIDGDIKVES